MKDILSDLNQWTQDGVGNIALATVVKTWGSAPRRPGAKMAVTATGSLAGSVSGGCVEGAVIEAALETLETGQPRLLHFGVADETAWGVGLACGGSIDIFVEKLDPSALAFMGRMIADERRGRNLFIIRGPQPLVGQRTMISSSGESWSTLPADIETRFRDLTLDTSESAVIELDDDIALFAEVVRPAPTLVAVGGGDIAIALTKIAQLMGYQTTVVDPRRVFSSEERFPHVDQLIQKWPRTAFDEIDISADVAVALLTHDPKIDDPALKLLLDSNVFYLGALGSRKTHAKRLQRLEKMGFTADQTAKIHAPIGLDIGAANPQEIALSIMAEIVSARRGQKGLVQA